MATTKNSLTREIKIVEDYLNDMKRMQKDQSKRMRNNTFMMFGEMKGNVSISKVAAELRKLKEERAEMNKK